MSTTEPVRTLSGREWEVRDLISEGLTTAQIAERLGISVNTVRTYRQRILNVTGSRTMAHAVTITQTWPRR